MAGRGPRHAGTPLQRQLAGATATRPTALDAFRHARRTFLAGDRVDMQALARTLNVDRATLYRWVGSREQLLAEILWSLIDPTIADLRKTHCHASARPYRVSLRLRPSSPARSVPSSPTPACSAFSTAKASWPCAC